MYCSQLWNPDDLFHPFTHPLPDQPMLQRLHLRHWEREMIKLMTGRVGVAACFGSEKLSLTPFTHDPITIKEGDVFSADLYFTLSSNPNVLVHPHWGKPVFISSVGRILPRGVGQPVPRLEIPTEGMLAPGETKRLVSFAVTVRIPKATGGYMEIIGEGKFLVRSGE